MADPAEILRIAQLLETLFHVRKVPIRKTEQDLGLSNGYLSRVFSGKIELKYRHILDLLEVAGMEPRVFFELAYRVGGQPGDLVQTLSPVPEPKAKEIPSPDSRDFEAQVIELLVKFGLLEQPPTRSRPPKKPGQNPKSAKKPKPRKDPTNDPPA